MIGIGLNNIIILSLGNLGVLRRQPSQEHSIIIIETVARSAPSQVIGIRRPHPLSVFRGWRDQPLTVGR